MPIKLEVREQLYLNGNEFFNIGLTLFPVITSVNAELSCPPVWN